MFIIDITLKSTPLSLSVQRKTVEEAQATFQEVLNAMESGSSKILQLTCDRQPDKRIGVLSNEISAIQLSEKSGTTASGRSPGFFSMAE